MRISRRFRRASELQKLNSWRWPPSSELGIGSVSSKGQTASSIDSSLENKKEKEEIKEKKIKRETKQIAIIFFK